MKASLLKRSGHIVRPLYIVFVPFVESLILQAVERWQPPTKPASNCKILAYQSKFYPWNFMDFLVLFEPLITNIGFKSLAWFKHICIPAGSARPT